MTFPDVHLAGEAVAAFVDGELGSVAQVRARAHLDRCTECRRAVDEQREVSRRVSGAPEPQLPAGLLRALREIPMTADLGPADMVLAVDHGGLVFGTASTRLLDPPVPSGPRRTGSQPSGPPPGFRPSGLPPVTPARRGPQDGRPGSYPASRAPGRARRASRTRRALAGAVAGLAFGVFAATASVASYAAPDAPQRNLIRDVNGGTISRPVTGSVVGVRSVRASEQRRSDRGTGLTGLGETGLRVDHTDAARTDATRASRHLAGHSSGSSLLDRSFRPDEPTTATDPDGRALRAGSVR